ncbi:MAG: translation initiation factor IF-2 [Negativibacillus sp.]|nr:translation initiation factor IF-2 [Negativibacillus sp.]
MINDKYRISEVAKDLNVPMKELVELLEKQFPGEKKRTTALSNEELNFVFETYTQNNQMDSLDSYYAYREESKVPQAKSKPEKEKKEQQQKKAQPKPEEKPAEAVAESPAKEDVPPVKEAAKSQPVQPEVKPEPKPAEQAQPKPASAQKEADAQETQMEREKQDMSETPKRPGAKEGGKPAQKPQSDRPQNNRTNGDRGERRPQSDNRTGERRTGDRPQGGFRSGERSDRPQGGFRSGDRSDRPQGGFRSNDRPQGDFRSNDRNRGMNNNNNRPQQNKPAKPQKPAAAPRQASAINPELDENVNGKMIRHVDMRAANVELDKYNERYENIAPTNLAKRDDGVKKQKIGGRNNKKKNFMSKKDKEMEKLKKLEMERERRQKLHITLPDEITVGDLALKLKIQSAEIVKRLMALGEMKSVSDIIDYDTAALVAMEIGAKVEREVVVTIEDRLFDDSEDKDEEKVERPPVVVVMGHVDHGKTSILDAIRHADVTSTEAGGITQHIGAYQVNVSGKPITFLDTPGHEAFTAMRARGADITDIAVLVVAADDGIMPQTVESINHAKAAGISIIVAINKMDKPTANPDKVMQELTEYELVPEEWGGDVICVPVSAKTKMGIQDLLENILLVAEVKELKANPDRLAKGTVIEAKLDKGRGPVATILVQNGTLKSGDSVIAGTAVGRVRVMTNSRGERIETAGPSTPVEITGLAEVPAAGDEFNAVEDEKLARELVEQRRQQAKEKEFSSYQKVTLDNLFEQIEVGETKELPLIVKADVQGSVEAVKQSLEKLSNPEVRVKVIHGAVGAVSKSDVMLAQACGAIIVGFNVRPDPVARDMAETEGVDMRMYRVIYDAIEEISSAMKGMLAPKTREVELGRAEVREVFKITGVGTVAGCYVLEGKITRNAEIRIVRDGIIIADEHLTSLKRFKDDVKEVARGYECGMGIEKFGDLKVGDIFEAYMIEEYRD